MRLFLFALLIISLAGCQSVSKVLKNKDPEYKLKMAEQYYAKKKYHLAQQVYEDIMPYFKGSKQFEDIYYKYTYCAYYQRDYFNAENLFKTYLEVFPNSPRAEEMDYMRAYTFYKQSPKAELDQTNTIKAMGLMQAFINTHPGSPRIKEANEIIAQGHRKLETKDRNAALLYYDLGQFRAAATAYEALLNAYPDSDQSDSYKYMAIKSYFRFAELSVDEKKEERFNKVIDECNDFMERFPQSSFAKQVEEYLTLSQINLKIKSNEPSKTSA
jgi:outer membrane protein assembly factor BamD